jgi:hypothetical protein
MKETGIELSENANTNIEESEVPLMTKDAPNAKESNSKDVINFVKKELINIF